MVKQNSAKVEKDIIADGYHDGFGQWRTAPSKTISLIRQAMSENRAGGYADCKVLKVGGTISLAEPADLVLEDGTRGTADKKIGRDLPAGYHELIARDSGRKTLLLVTPGECYLPKSLKAWGWAVQLYAMRSQQSWGMGDLSDLRVFSRWAARSLGTDFILSNPLAAANPLTPQQASPYYPSSRLFLNPLYIRVEEVPGAVKLKAAIDKIAKVGRALNDDRSIHRDAVFKLKMEALAKIWKSAPPDKGFEKFCAAQGKPLADFATFCVLAQHFKAGWPAWPAEFRQISSPAVSRFAKEQRHQIRFQQWLQWILASQFQRAARELPVIQDLPVGVDPGGADAWRWQDLLAPGMAIGAPPDGYNSEGQNWGMQPFIPQRLRQSGYEPFRQTLQAMLRLGGGLRIDHVMGLFRLFWIPSPGPAKAGTYVRYSAEEFLAVLAIESQRAKALVVGEDLGTVEAGVREELGRQKVLSYRLLWFESLPVKKYPKQALAAVTTHDLFTVAGLWTGADLTRQKEFGLKPDEKGMNDMAKKLSRKIRLPLTATAAEAVVKTYRLLAKTPSQLITATLEDALAVEERPNMPGSNDDSKNWSVALPIPLEKIKKQSLIKEVAKACRR
jgi:4-alpha-glucanotransferase